MQQDRLLALLDAAAEPELGDRVAEQQRRSADHHEPIRNGGKPMTPTTTNSRKNRIAADDRADGLDAQPVGDAQVAGVAGEREPLLGASRVNDVLAIRDIAPGQPGGERAQRPLDERLLELELLEVLGLHRARAGSGAPGPGRPASCRPAR